MHSLTFHFLVAAKGNPWDWAIAFFSGGPYAHVEVEFVDVPMRRFFSSAPPVGVSWHDLPNYDPAQWVRHTVQVSDDQFRALILWANAQLGDKYDWLSILTWDCPWHLYGDHRWYCSEIATALLQRIGQALALRPTTRIDPTQLERYLASRVHAIEIGGEA